MKHDLQDPDSRIGRGKKAIFEGFDFLRYFLFWLYWFYPRAKDTSVIYLLYFFPFQKLLRINGRVPWPVHFTSRVVAPGRVELGADSTPGGSPGCYVQAKNGIIIGANLRMGPNVGLISANHSEEDYDEWVQEPPIRIGDNVWIGMNAVILPGVTIGSNVIIGCNSVVSRDIPSNSVAAGVPCRVIRQKTPYHEAE